MIPFGDNTVTLLHRADGGYTPYILRGCSWRFSKIRSVNGTAVARSPEISCRIPAGQTMPDVGDVLILGAYDLDAVDGEITLVRLLNALMESGAQAMRATQIRDNSGAPMPHYAVTGGI